MNDMPDEALDDDGYPTEGALEYVRTFKPLTRADWHKLFEYLKPIWAYANVGYFSDSVEVDATTGRKRHEYRLSTAGWSGNEDVIAALQDNAFFWLDCWYSSQRGGHHVFRTELKL